MQALTAIGITSQTGVSCEDTDLTTSISGLFLDELPGMGADFFAPSGTYGACTEPRSYLSRLIRARKEALSLVNEALLTGLSTANKLQSFNFNGYIGQRQGVGLATGSVLTIRTSKSTDAALHISKVGVVASGEGTAIITLSSPEGELHSFTIPVAGNGYAGIDSTLKLPLDGTVYTFDVETTGTVKLQNNKIGCGCGAKDTAMLTYLNFSGSSAHGISLTAVIKCEGQDTLSRLHANDTNVAAVMARMLYYRAGVVLCDYILGDVQPQSSDTDLEYVKAKRANLLYEFESRRDWLLETGLDIKGSACFACSGPRLVSIG